MKNNQSEEDGPLHQTVAEGFEFNVGAKSIAVEFTDQQLSAHAGSATFWRGCTRRDGRRCWVGSCRSGRRRSNNHLTPLEKALAFSHGLLCEARKLAHVAYFRRDPVVPEMLGIRRVASASVLFAVLQRFRLGG